MKKPPLPAQEKERLTRLRSLKILDTEPEERFDRLTRMAKRALDVPIALISLIDENRQWFKSKQGLDASETSRDISFCGHAILDSEIFVIEDAALDLRFADNPLVTGEPRIRFYAGVPLRYANGGNLGTLCVIDRKPRKLNDDDILMLRDLAEIAESEINSIQMATIDDLTRISNRRGFIALAQNSINLCARQSTPVSMVYFDINNFKPINDQHGHAEGDHALITFADLMRETFRDSDVFARIGGDEFAVLLTNTSKEYAAEIVQRFRDSVDKHNRHGNRGYDLSFADGIVSITPEAECSVHYLLREADMLMYEEKQRGSSVSLYQREA